MSLVINTNVASLNGQRNLAATQAQQAQTFQRLSTGLRVNSAKDDAAGLYLAQAQTKDIRGLGMATRNAGDGISMAQTAEGALDQIGKNLQRINELAIQSANGTYNEAARGGLQKEVDQLTQEISRIVETTEFNGQKLLNKDASAETLQIGFENNAGSRITTGLQGGIIESQGMEDVTFTGAGRTFAIDRTGMSGTGGTDDANVVDGFVKATGFTTVTAGSAAAATAGADLQKEINLALKNFQGNAATLGDAVSAKFGADTEGTIVFTAGGIDFSIKASQSTAGVLTSSEATASFNGTNIVLDSTKGTGITALGTSDFKNNPAATIGAIEITSIGENDDGDDGFVKVADANALNAVIGGGLNGTLSIDISDQASAQNAITATRNAIDLVSEIRAEFGANQNRFEAVISGNQTYSENLQAARSRIQDADFAVETANLAKQQVLQQAGVAALGQANASSQVVLGLL